MRYTLPFGDNPLSFEVSGVSEVREIRPRQEASLDPIDDAFTEIIDAPVGTLPLEEMLSKGDRVLVVCEDDTRPTPIRLILPSLFRRLQTIGIPAAKIRILMAYGLHRPMSRQALAKKLGPEAVGAFSVLHHDAFQRNDLFHVGDTSFGTPVYLNKAIKEADMVIGIGTISLSKEAGYGGAQKIIMPGIAGAETIYRSHAKVADHPNQVGRIRDNPIRKEIEESGKMAGLTS